jgi:transposase-like protein
MTTETLNDEAAVLLAKLQQAEAEQPEQPQEPEPKQTEPEVVQAGAGDDEPEPGPSRDELRQRAARMVLESGATVRDAAAKTGLSASAVQRAVSVARRTGIPEAPAETEDGDDAALPVNFDSWGAVLASYKALERRFHEVTRENKTLREQLGEAVIEIAGLRQELMGLRRAMGL